MKKFSEMTKKTSVIGEDYVPIIDSTASTIETKNKAALLSTIKSFVEDEFTAGNPKLVFGVGSNSDPAGYPRVEFLKSGVGSTQGVSFVYYDANGNATFNDFIRSDGAFIPSKVDKSGDTMTGALYLKDDNFPYETPSQTKYHSSSLQWINSAWEIIGHLTTQWGSDGLRGFQMGTRKTANGSTVYHTLGIYIDDNNSQYVSLNKTAWQTALGITGINLQNNSRISDNATNIHFYTNTEYSGNQYADWAMGYNGRFAVRIRTRASADDEWTWGTWQYLDTWYDITPTAGTNVGALGSTKARYNPLTKLCCLNINIRIDGASLENSENLLTGLPKPTAAMQTSIAATTNDVVRVKFTTTGNMQVDGAKTISTTKQYYNGYITYPYSSLE